VPFVTALNCLNVVAAFYLPDVDYLCYRGGHKTSGNSVQSQGKMLTNKMPDDVVCGKML